MAEQAGKIRDVGAVRLEQVNTVSILTLSRPSARNSLTWEMYQQLEEHLFTLEADSTTRVVVIRGDGNQAFAAGTDISQFVGFTGKDGIEYEQKIDRIIDRLIHFPKPTIAAVQGYAVGGGLMISTACDLRYATHGSQFAAPMSRTLGNCLSLTNYQRLVDEFGAMRIKELLFTARMMSAAEAFSAGFLTAILDEHEFFPSVLEIAKKISQNAPLTISATKDALIRINKTKQSLIAADEFNEVVERVYGSADFAEGVRAHLEKRKPNWSGK